MREVHDHLFLTVFGAQAHHDLGKGIFLTRSFPMIAQDLVRTLPIFPARWKTVSLRQMSCSSFVMKAFSTQLWECKRSALRVRTYLQ